MSAKKKPAPRSAAKPRKRSAVPPAAPPQTQRTTKKRTTSAPDWGPRFLARLAETANISEACTAANVSRSGVYQRRDKEEAFAAQIAEALEQSIDALELEARRRAHDGLRRVQFYKGQPIMVPVNGPDGEPVIGKNGYPVLVPYVEHEYSDTLMIFLLKAHRPERYRERYEVKHEGGVKLEIVEEIVDGKPEG